MSLSVEELLRRFVARVGGRVGDEERADVIDYLDHDEWGLALDVLDDFLFEAEAVLSPDEKAQMSEIAQRMGMPVDGFAMLRAADPAHGPND